jgi:ATP-dependent helicase/nuclease subunit A
VQRMIAVVAAGKTTIDRIAGVTFTEKAAGELKLRLRSEFKKARRTGHSSPSLDARGAHRRRDSTVGS